MTEVPHLMLRAEVEIDGQVVWGHAADNLPPKWFTKDAEKPFDVEIAELRSVIDSGGAHAIRLGEAETVFEWWQAVYAAQKVTAKDRGWPPLLAGFGVSMIERAVVDAFCRARGLIFAQAVRENALGVDLGAIYPELAGSTPADWLPVTPLESVIARHTVGLTDPLTVDEIPAAERLADGLPQALEECGQVYGLTHLKIKLSGDIERDRERLSRLASLFPAAAFTLDGNENFKAVAPFRTLWGQYQADPVIARFLKGLIFVEQPLHRDVALSPEVAADLLAWEDRPPLIIDESEGELGALETALASGYSGTSHKNCKGVFRSLGNASLLASRRRQQPDRSFLLSGEDLTNLGPVALTQDLAAAATFGITHVERNGHHYFRGLSEFAPETQQAVLERHSDLFREHHGYPTVRVEQGRVSTRSVLAAPFGYAVDAAVLI